MPPKRPYDDIGARLSQEETSAIADLLRQGIPETDQQPAPGEPIVLRYDLVGGTSLRVEDLPGLQLVHERYCAELANEFRRAVGSEGMFFAEPVHYAKFVELYARMSAPTIVLICNLEGLGCSAIITLEPELSLHFIDLLMGGEGGAVRLRDDIMTRGLTLAEKGVLRHVVAVLSRALGIAWADFANVGLELQRVGTDPRHASIFEPSEPMVDLAVRVDWGTLEGTIRLILPTSFLARFDGALSRTAAPTQTPRSESFNVELMRQNLMPVVVNLSAIFGTTELTVERLLSLEPGDVVRLDADPSEPLVIQIEGEPKMTGFPTVQHGNVAVRIVELLGDGPAPHHP